MKTLQIKQTSWDLSPLFKNDNDQKILKYRKVNESRCYKFLDKWKGRKDFLQDPNILKQALDEYENLLKFYGLFGSERFYFWLRTQQDQSDPQIKAKYNKALEFSNRIQADLQFFTLKLSKVPKKIQKKFLKSPALRDYRHFLERLFNETKYLLSEPEEKILTLKGPVSHSNWVKMTTSFLSKEERRVVLEDGQKALKNFSEIASLLMSQNKKTRDTAAQAFNNILEKYIDVAEVELNSVLQNKQLDDYLRGITRPELTRFLSDDIDSEVVDKLVAIVSSRFDIPQKYYQLKAKLLGVKKLEYHERNVPIGYFDREYSFEEAANLIYSVFIKLDRTFAKTFLKFIRNSQIDVYPCKNKTDGAFCATNLISDPSYILLNFARKLDNVLTIAHEMGHAINNELINKKQNALNAETPLSTAEVASTFMEDFVFEEILKEPDDELRLSVMMRKLNDDISTIFRQIACYQFEQELHQAFREKGYLSKKEIGELFRKHMKSYMGDYVKQSPGSENWWVYWNHIRNFFYNYSYASGLLISKSLQSSVRQNPEFIQKVKQFLAAGSSESPKNIFKNLGVDITDKKFWDKGLSEIADLLDYAERLAEKLGKLKSLK